MRHIALPVAILLLTFIAGVGSSRLLQNALHLGHEKGVLASRQSPSSSCRQFIRTGSLLEPDYHIYWYQTPGSSDAEEITFYGDFRSAQVTREHFESNATTDAAALIERGYKFDQQGRRIGERVVTVFEGSETFRICWTEGDIFWSVQAPSLHVAREFEESEIVRSITMSNKALQSEGGF
jgi:hypothetical protein